MGSMVVENIVERLLEGKDGEGGGHLWHMGADELSLVPGGGGVQPKSLFSSWDLKNSSTCDSHVSGALRDHLGGEDGVRVVGHGGGTASIIKKCQQIFTFWCCNILQEKYRWNIWYSFHHNSGLVAMSGRKNICNMIHVVTREESCSSWLQQGRI